MAWVGTLVCGLLPTATRAGQLGDLRGQVRRDSASSSQTGSSSPSNKGDDCDDDDGDSILGCLLSGLFSSSGDSEDDSADTAANDTAANTSEERGWGGAFTDVLTMPWGLPHRLAGDNLGCEGFFPDAPYDHDDGYIAIDPFGHYQYHRWAGHFRAEYADDFADLSRIGARLVLESSSRWGIDTEWNYWRENLGNGDHDWLTTGDGNIVWRFAQNEHIAMRSGLGISWLDDRQETNYGFNFTYGLDFFPCKPWILSADIDWGTLGGRSLFHGRATAGVIVGHAEVYVGYDYYDVGDVALNGLVAGVGFWF